MSQGDILKVLEKHGKLVQSEIINHLSSSEDDWLSSIRMRLKQMRKYGEVKFIKIKIVKIINNKRFYSVENCKGQIKELEDDELFKKYPEMKGKRITNMCYLYYL